VKTIVVKVCGLCYCCEVLSILSLFCLICDAAQLRNARFVSAAIFRCWIEKFAGPSRVRLVSGGRTFLKVGAEMHVEKLCNIFVV